MNKRIFFVLMTLFVVLSGFALSDGEYVYTPQGRFLIIGDNLNENSAFYDFTGWSIASEDGMSLEDVVIINSFGYAEDINSVQFVDATEGKGMYFTFEPSDPSRNYVVSYKLKGATTQSVRVKTVAVSTNLVKVEGNSDGYYGGMSDVVLCNTAEELKEDWQTFNYAIVGDGTARTYYISLTGMAANIEFADLQIAEATQVADLRQRDAMLEKLNAYKNCYGWSDDILNDYGITEIVEMLNLVNDFSTQSDLDEALNIAKEIIDEFLIGNMDDYLAGGVNDYNYLRLGTNRMQKVSMIGEWNCMPAGRGFWAVGDYPDLGHYQSTMSWNMGALDTPMGVYMRKDLTTGSYVFAIEANAAVREPKKAEWNIDEGLNPAYGIAYVVKVVDSTATDTIAAVVKDLKAVDFTPFYVPAQITEDGTYEIGFKAYCKEAYMELKQGSVVYVANASIWGKNESQYNLAQLAYEDDVREQITAGRDAINISKSYIADDAYWWGKAELGQSVSSIEPNLIRFEAMSQDDIIATYDENAYDKNNRIRNAEEGLLVYEVYDNVVRGIFAANKKFVAVNDTLNSIQVVIDNAEATLALRIYDAAIGRDALKAAIEKAKSIQAEMKATQYSEENAAIILAANAELNEAIELFKTTIPAEAIATIVDIDFEQDAVYDDWTGYYRIPGAVGSMEFNHFATEPIYDDSPYEQGFWENGEQKWKGFLHVGNGTGTVTFDPTSGTGDMGTNILKVSCDFYIVGLINRYVGFTLKNEAGETLAGLCRNYYNGTDTENTFNADMSKVWAKWGSAYNDASPADAEEPTANPLQKTRFEVIMDYGTMTMYCTITSPNGSTTSEPVEFSGVPTQFVLVCNYDNKISFRRCWFDNLKIEKINAGEPIVNDNTWTVAGADALCGVSWDPTETSNNMTTRDGINYTLEKDNVVLEAGVSYQYKVVANHTWDECYPYDDNASLTVDDNGLYSVRFYFNSDYKTLSVEYWKTGDVVLPEKTWTIAGVGAVLGSAWQPEDTANDMTSLGDGNFMLVKDSVSLLADVEYEFKIVANHSWDENYGVNGEPGGGNCYFTVDEDGLYNVSFFWNYNSKELYAYAERADYVVSNNYMYVAEQFQVSKGKVCRLPISLSNNEGVTAFQLDLYLPEGMYVPTKLDENFNEVLNIAYTNRAKSTHIIDAEYLYDGALRIVGYSSENDGFRSSDGVLFNIGIMVEDWIEVGDYTAMMSNVLITNTAAVERSARNVWFNITVGGLKGDANNDSSVTMSDVVAVVNNVLGKYSNNFNVYNADVTGDGNITMSDVVGIVNIVLGKSADGSRSFGETEEMLPGTLSLKSEADRMSVMLDNNAAYTAFQMDVTLPAGMSLENVLYTGRQTLTHSLSMSQLENGKVRIIGWSANNADLKGNTGELLSFELSGAQTTGVVTIDNIRFAMATGAEHQLAAVEAFGQTTGIAELKSDKVPANAYDLQGRRVEKAKKGLYIVDGKKNVVK